MKIRKATKKDFPEIGKLIKNEYIKPPYKESWTPQSALKTLNYYNKIANITILSDKNIIGFIIWREEQYNKGKNIIIEEIIIDSKYQKKGLGKKLVQHVEAQAKKKKINAIFLSANKKSNAFKFYKKQGFINHDNFVLMEKEMR
jgi:N-acetylglutamate synthase-like GNAT family acetyltransferase